MVLLMMLLLLLQQTVNLEPVGASAVSRSGLGHADEQTFAQTACFAGGAVLLVDDALAVDLTVGYRGQIVVGATEKRLWKRDE